MTLYTAYASIKESINERVNAMTITLTLNERQLSQLIHSLENDWIDNDAANQKVINNILKKIEQNN